MTQRKRKVIFILVILLVIAIAAKRGFDLYVGMKKAEYMADMKTPVEAATVVNQDWPTKIQATGTLNAEQGIMLKSEAAGIVTAVYFKSGQTVKAGAPLLDIDPGILKAQLAAAQAQADLTSGDYGRAIELFKRGALSKQDMQTALANKQADAAKVQALQAQLNHNVIKAPISGKLGLKLFNLGDYITIGQSLVNLQSIDPLRVDFSVPENNVGEINKGDTVVLSTGNNTTQTFTGTVSAVDSAINIDTRTLSVRADVPNPAQKLLPGMFVQVTLYTTGAGKPLATVPQIAVVYDANGDYVYKIVDDKALKIPVKIIKENKQQVAVTALQAGDRVVTQGQLKIHEGALVHAIH